MPLEDQVREKRLVCPVTKQPLRFEGDSLVTADRRVYPVIAGRPMLVPSRAVLDEYLAENNSKMEREYTEQAQPAVPSRRPLAERLRQAVRARRDRVYHNPASYAAFSRVQELAEKGLGVSIGGGPDRYPKFVNLNIGPFQNVDVVGDAYSLPYADGSVDAVFCGAVLEHLEFPERAVAEQFRVLRPGGLGYIDTPFLQPYHGYPNHFQGFTLTGHQRPFERAGFEVLESGPDVGPSHVITHMIECYRHHYCTSGLRRYVFSAIHLIAGLFLKPKDTELFQHPYAMVMPSTTFLLVRKPKSTTVDWSVRNLV